MTVLLLYQLVFSLLLFFMFPLLLSRLLDDGVHSSGRFVSRVYWLEGHHYFESPDFLCFLILFCILDVYFAQIT